MMTMEILNHNWVNLRLHDKSWAAKHKWWYPFVCVSLSRQPKRLVRVVDVIRGVGEAWLAVLKPIPPPLLINTLVNRIMEKQLHFDIIMIKGIRECRFLNCLIFL